MPTSFAVRLEAGFAKHGHLCVGVDPHSALLDNWGLGDDIAGLETFAMTVLDACVGEVAAIKPQVSFFERFGSSGFAVLEKFAERAAQSDLQVIMDAKRGDIGSTMQGYFDAWLGQTAPFVCDALTVSPYLGVDSLKEFMSLTLERGKGLFVLAATSNPEAKRVQRAKIEDLTVACDVLKNIEAINAISASGPGKMGSIGVVVGATLNLSATGIYETINSVDSLSPILAPGFGFQGAELENTVEVFGAGSARVLASVSRSVLEGGASGLAGSISAAKHQLEKAYSGV